MRSGNGAPEEFGKPRHNRPPEYGPGHPVWEAAKQVALALEGNLVRVTSVDLEKGHIEALELLVVTMEVEIPLNWQTATPFAAGSIGSEMVTLTQLRVKYSTNMTKVFAIELSNESMNVRITEQAIDEHGEELREIALRARKSFFDHISANKS